MPGSNRFASDMETFSEIQGGTLRASRHLNKKHPKLSCQEAFGGLLFVQTTLILEIWFKSLWCHNTLKESVRVRVELSWIVDLQNFVDL